MQKHRSIMEIDYFSYVELTKLLLPHFIARQSGHFVITSGFMGKIAMPFRSGYCAAKFALHGFFDSLRAEIAGQHIFVTLLVPGAMKTHLVSKAMENNLRDQEPIHNTPIEGCDVNIAAKQAVEAIKKKKFETYIGNRDKSAALLILNRFIPNVIKRLIIRKAG
jgi:dehydrogenase/reductase SDR family protein 7B